MKKLKNLFLPFIILAAFLLGARMILAGDFFYLFDQARDYLLIKNIVDTHTLALIGTHSGLGGFFHGPFWLYMLAPVYILFGGNPFSFAYFYILLELVTVFVAYIVGARLYGQKPGAIISLLAALSPVVWNSVPNTIGVNVEPLVFLGLFYFLIKYLRGDSKSFVFASFFAGLTLQFETALPLVLIPSMVIAFFLNKKAVKNFKIMILGIFAYILSVSSFILFDLRHQFLMTKAVLGAFGGGEKGKGYLVMKDRIIEHFGSLLGSYKSFLFSQDILLTILFGVIIVFAVFLIFQNKEKIKKEFLFLLLFPALVYLFFIFYPYAIWPEYVFGLLIPVILAFYLALTLVWENTLGKVLVVLFFGLTLFNFGLYIGNQYLGKYQENTSSGSYKNQKTVVEWLYKDAGKGKFGYFVYTPETYTHGMDYLIWYYGKKNPNTFFESQKDSITYLILYPHTSNDEGAYDFWKKNVVRTSGKILETKEFTGGITVQKILIGDKESPVDPNYYQGLIFR